ncbi:hypothetical protein Ancab_007648 [Ancistrocladus abbreviatus]
MDLGGDEIENGSLKSDTDLVVDEFLVATLKLLSQGSKKCTWCGGCVLTPDLKRRKKLRHCWKTIFKGVNHDMEKLKGFLILLKRRKILSPST